MKRSLLIFFTWTSLLLIAFSCRAPKIVLTGVMPDRVDQRSDVASPRKMTYAVMVIYKESELSGRVLLKEDSTGTYRIAFYNEVGMTYFEGKLEHRALEVVNIIPVLDNKIFLKKFRKSITRIPDQIYYQ